jgi:hypothetical protein
LLPPFLEKVIYKKKVSRETKKMKKMKKRGSRGLAIGEYQKAKISA